MVQKEGRLQAIICAGIAWGDSDAALIGQLNQPGARCAPVALVP
jgi:hypothetical protein